MKSSGVKPSVGHSGSSHKAITGLEPSSSSEGEVEIIYNEKQSRERIAQQEGDVTSGQMQVESPTESFAQPTFKLDNMSNHVESPIPKVSEQVIVEEEISIKLP